MQRSTFVIAIVIVCLLFSTVLLLMQSWTLTTQRDQALDLSAATLSLLRLERGCSADPQNFDLVRGCVLDAITRTNKSNQMSFDRSVEFHNANPTKNDSGYLILTYLGKQTLNSSMFILLQNRAQVDRGCSVPELIPQNYSCRLDFKETCKPGDVLEVRYTNTSVYTKTC
jgi:hypothetical protein